MTSPVANAWNAANDTLNYPLCSIVFYHLVKMRLVERQLPATVPPAEQRRSRQGRYHIRDAYFRFYFRFIMPHRDELAYRPERALPLIREELCAFVGQTAFEDLSREWTAQAGRIGELPFTPEAVGSHWNRRVQVDVVAVNWRERAVLLGEYKWGTEPMARDVIRRLVETKTPQVMKDLPGEGWKMHYACFAHARAREHGALMVNLETLERDLADQR